MPLLRDEWTGVLHPPRDAARLVEAGPPAAPLDRSHEHAEDPLGLQRPADRDEESSADEFADSVSELPKARLVAAPGRPKEVLLSDDPPPARAKHATDVRVETEAIAYPEWDYRIGAWRTPGAHVHCLDPQLGPQQWVAISRSCCSST